MFFNIFHIKTPAWFASAAGNRLSHLAANSSSAPIGDAVPAHEKTNLIDQYLGVLLMVFVDAGLVEVSPPPQSTNGHS